MEIAIFVYCLLAFWIAGILFPPKKPQKKKTVEEELGQAVMKYLSSQNKTAEKTAEKTSN